jgi:hypothetical protein
MSMQLKILRGEADDMGREFALPSAGVLRIGRGRETDTLLKDRTVSKNHCVIKVSGGQVHLTDTQSAEGTYVNEQRVAQATLRPGDQIRIGKTVLLLEGEGGAVHDDKTQRAELTPELLAALKSPPKPQAPAPPVYQPQGLPVSCQCGLQLQFRPICEGTWVRCPGCGDFLQLPGKANIGESVMMTSMLRLQHSLPRHKEAIQEPLGPSVAKVTATVLATLFILGMLGGVAYFIISQPAEQPTTGGEHAKPPPTASESTKDAPTPKKP